MNKTVSLTLSLLLMLATALSLSAARISGTVLDHEGRPIQGVAFRLHPDNEEKEDTVFYTDFEGRYDFTVADGRYECRLSKEGYDDLTFNANLTKDFIGDVLTMNANAEQQARMLEEVKVTARMLEQFANRTEMYLSKENRDFGINALDAVSSLPLFQPNINGKELTNLAGSSVSILINGRRASPEELQNLTGYNIRKVVYYENAPAKFAALFSGPVINILLNTVTRIEFQGNLRAQLSNGWGETGDVGATLLMPEHYLNGAFNINANQIDGISSTQRYSYPDLTDSFEMQDGTSRRLNTRTFLSYQWDRGPQMLFANFSYNSSTNRMHNPMEVLESSGAGDVHGVRDARSHRTTDMMKLELYYTYQFRGGLELSLDVTNAYNKSTRSLCRIQAMEDGSAYDDFLNDADTRNKVYQLDASAMFSSPLWGGSFSCSLNENYRRLSQDYVDNFFPGLPSRNLNSDATTYANVEYEREFGRFGMDLSLAVFWSEMNLSEGGRRSQANPYPRLTFSYNATDNMTLRLMGWVQSSQNSIGQMNLNRHFIDTRYFGENLPYERQVFKYSISLDPTIAVPSARLYIMPGVRWHYTRQPYVSYIFAEGEDFIRRSLQIPFTNEVYYTLGLSWQPVAGLNINPYFSGRWLAYRTPLTPVRFNWNDLRINATYSTGAFQFAVQCNTPSKSMHGVQISYSGWAAVVNALWKKGDWHVGVLASFTEHNQWSLAEVPGFSDYSTSWSRSQGFGIGVFAGWSFKAGKEVRARRKNKRLSGSASETGFSN